MTAHAPEIAEPVTNSSASTVSSVATSSEIMNIPLSDAKNRVTKKPFGLQVSPQNSPVSPERFSGYHTGTDFEIFSNETDLDIEIHALCDGKVVRRAYIDGYGGVLVQSCIMNNDSVTALYGHLRLSSIEKSVNDAVTQGERIGVLGKGYSSETDSERKHLHVSIHKGATINVRGYVQTKAELDAWIDPATILDLTH